MGARSLKIINISTVIAILLLLIIERIFFPGYSIFSMTAGALFWAILYVNLRKAILGFIEAHKDIDIQIDPERVERFNKVKLCIIILGVMICALFLVFTWIYMNAQFIWGIFFVYAIILLVSFHNLFSTVTYLVAKKPVVNFPGMLLLLFFVVLSGIFVWVYMNTQFVFFLIFIILIMFLLDIYVNIRDTVKIAKMINNKPVDIKKERLIKIINYLPLFVIIALILVIYLNIQAYLAYVLLLNLIGPMFLLMIVANVWKFISDIS
jgi:hypothetical protein